MKYVYDGREARNETISKEDGPTHHSEMSTKTKAPEERVSDVDAKILVFPSLLDFV